MPGLAISTDARPLDIAVDIIDVDGGGGVNVEAIELFFGVPDAAGRLQFNDGVLHVAVPPGTYAVRGRSLFDGSSTPEVQVVVGL